MIDFARGHPNSSLLPSEETRVVLEKLLCRPAGGGPDALRNALQYGNEEGNNDFLDELRAFLQRHTEDDDFGELSWANADESSEGSGRAATSFFVTNGVSHGLELLCATQTQPGDVVLVERPTYFLVGGILKAHGLVLRGLPMHESTGELDVDKLIEMVENGTMDVPRMI